MKTLLLSTKLLMFLLILSFVNATAQKNNDFNITVLNETNDKISLNFDLNNYSIKEVTKNGVTYSSIIFDSNAKTKQKGWSEIPFTHASIQLSNDKNVDIRIESSKFVDINLSKALLPSRGTIYRNQDPSTIEYRIDEKSMIDKFYPTEIIRNTEPFILREVRGENIYINPFRYNAVTKTLRVYKNITISVTKNNETATNPILKQKTLTKEMISTYNSMFVNFHHDRWNNELSEFGEILVIYTQRDSAAIQPWVEWKNQKGFKVYQESVATGTNVTSLIQTEYDNNTNILYVLLVGDFEDVASTTEEYSGFGIPAYDAPEDPFLGNVAGTDNYHDVIIGRFSAENATDVTTQVNKTIQYEKYTDTDATWLSKGAGIASDQGPGDDNEKDFEHADVIKTNKLLPFTYDEVTDIYDPGATSTMVTTAINSGLGIITYVGHGDWDKFETSAFDNSNISALTNGNKLPFITSVACVNGQFNLDNPCFAETWLRKDGGGAIATLMSAIYQAWSPPMVGQDYMIDLLTQGYDYDTNPGTGTSTTYGKTTFGSIVNNGIAMMLAENEATDEIETAKTWTIFGDPSFQTRTKAPEVLTISNPTITPGVYTTQILLNGNPFENAIVSLYREGSQPSAALTDASGNVSINHLFEDSVLLTVTGFNLKTYYDYHLVQESESPTCDFAADNTTITAGQTINFTDLSQNYPTSWNWSFDGAVTTSSTEHNPSIEYNIQGIYPVTLVCTNSAGSDSLTKTSYITVNAISEVPVVDFTASSLTINIGESIDFTDLSTNLPNGWTWTFESGTPSSSTVQNPAGIVYNTSGTFSVTLLATNSIGSGDSTKTAYITVNTPEFCSAGAGTKYEFINNVSVGDIDNSSNWISGGYEDYTNLSTDMVIGTSYSVQVDITEDYSSDQLYAWVDWNKDYEFDESTEKVYTSPSASDSYSFDITPPSNSNLGEITMRLRLNDTGNGSITVPCGVAGYGEVEDYTINVKRISSLNNIFDKKVLSIYPNPSTGLININASQQINSIEIINILGETIISKNNIYSQTTFDLSNNKGIYFIKVKLDDKTFIKKVIVQ